MGASPARAAFADRLLLLLLFLLRLRRLRLEPRLGDGGGSSGALGTAGTVELGSGDFWWEDVREGIVTRADCGLGFSAIVSLPSGAGLDKSALGLIGVSVVVRSCAVRPAIRRVRGECAMTRDATGDLNIEGRGCHTCRSLSGSAATHVGRVVAYRGLFFLTCAQTQWLMEE